MIMMAMVVAMVRKMHGDHDHRPDNAYESDVADVADEIHDQDKDYHDDADEDEDGDEAEDDVPDS